MAHCFAQNGQASKGMVVHCNQNVFLFHTGYLSRSANERKHGAAVLVSREEWIAHSLHAKVARERVERGASLIPGGQPKEQGKADVLKNRRLFRLHRRRSASARVSKLTPVRRIGQRF